MTIASAIHIAATPIFVLLAIFAVARNPRAALNWFCAATMICLGIYSFADIFLPLLPLIPLVRARFFCHIRDTGLFLFPGFWLLFSMALTGRRRLLHSWLTWALLGIFMVVLNVAQWAGWGGIGCKASPLAWTHDMVPGFWVYVVYLLSTVVLGLTLIARYGARADEPRQRRQARVITVTGLASLILSMGHDVGYLAVSPERTTLLAPALTLILAIGLFVSITRYGLAAFTPQVAADQILATMLDPLLLLSPDGMIVNVNRASEDVLGYSRNELANRPASLVFAQPDEFASVFRRVHTAGQVNGIELIGKARLNRGSGISDPGPGLPPTAPDSRPPYSDIPVLLSARVMRHEGSVLGSVWVLRDISQLKRAEEQIRAKSERLESVNTALNEERARLLELTGQLTRANDELKVLTEAKSDFVAAASHDLRTPLTTIIEGISLTEDGTLGPVNEGQRKFLGYAHEDAERLSELITNLLDMRKIEQGKMEPTPLDIALDQVLSRIAASYQTFARDKGLSIEVSVPPDASWVCCDEGHFHRVIANLLSNAIKFTPPGGRIALRAEAAGARDGGRGASPLMPCVTVSVADTGVGIPADQQHRIFGRFEQVRGAGVEAQVGSGLGLSVCKQLVELNGGTIGFTSEEHKGSTFYFTLPAGKPSSADFNDQYANQTNTER